MLIKYSSCDTWLQGFRSDKTKKNYMLHLSLFCNFHNTDPEALILLKSKPDMIKDMLLKYVIHLKRTAKTTAGKPIEGEICINTISTYMTGIQSFIDFHEIPIAWKKIFRFIPESVPSNLRAYKKEEIRKLLSVADLRDRCIILMMASGGLRVGALSDLQIKHQSVLDKDSSDNSDGGCAGSGIGLLKVYPNSKHDSYTALLTPEAMDAIHSYIEWRKDHGERISDESPLIRDKFDVFMARKSKLKFLKVNTIYRTMARLLDKAGIHSEQLQPDHSFRYFLIVAL
jgi:integrase